MDHGAEQSKQRQGRAEPPVDVSVLIPVLDEERHLALTLRGLRGQAFEGSIEFLFVDGRSSDGTRRMLELAALEDARIRVLDNPHRGIPYALNIGLENARGEFVARMDAHTAYPPQYLSLGVERLRRGDAEWVSGPQIASGQDGWSEVVAAALSTRLGVGGASFRNAEREIEVDAGYTGIWRRETLARHGGWDEGWAVNEDGELAARVRADGGRIVCVPELGASYTPRDSLGSLARQYWRYGQYRAKTSGAHPESMRRSHVLPPLLVLTLLVAGLPRRPPPAKLGVAAYAVALAATAFSSRARAPGRLVTIPAALATMHVSWGAGFLVGCLRFGPPLAAFRALLR